MRVAVMCIGNELLMDEGVGPACARYLVSRYRFPDNVEVVDRAVMGMALLNDLRVYDTVLVLDAVEVPDARPGQVFSFAPDDVAPTPPGMASLHEVRFADVLGSAELLGIRCAGHCLGIQVENLSPSEFVVALTPRVAAALPLLAQAAVRYLRDELGLEVDDLLAAGDPYRAGRRMRGSRDFSRAGRCGEGPEVAAEELAAAPRAVLPAVYGEPDASVMARYLATSLRAVGASGAWDEEAVPACVEVALPSADACQEARAREVAARFGLEDACGSGAGGGVLRFAAYVAPSTTDYDCDALVGACLEAVEGAKRRCGEER